MRVHAEMYVPPEDLRLFEEIRKVVPCLPDVDLGIDKQGKKILVSCHHLCRAISAVFGIEYKDGHFSKVGWCHSWLTTKSGVIIDPCPWALIGGPIMVVASPWRTPWRRLYIEERLDGLDKPEFLEQVERVTAAIRETKDRISAGAQ